MDLVVKKISQIKGHVVCPASKSYSIRAFIIAACGGKSNIISPSDCDDAKTALKTAKALGAKIIKFNNGFNVQGDILPLKQKTVCVDESGTVLRFLLPLLALHDQQVIVEGKGSLIGRPNTFLIKTLQDMGVNIKGSGDKHSVPIKLNGGVMSGGKIKIDASVSSQFVSALLIACPQLAVDTSLTLTGDLVSGDYITMTLQMLERAGIKIKINRDRRYLLSKTNKINSVCPYLLIPGRQKYKGLKNFHVPSDYGLAAFLMGAAALVKSNVSLKGCFDDSLVQADGHIIEFLERMGVKMVRTKKSIKIKGPFELKGGDFSLKACPDLVPIMAVLALFAKGRTRLYNIAHAKVKESDRISDLRKELLKVGADVRESKDELLIYPREEYKSGQILDPHNDHRLAMAFSILGLRIGCTVKNIECSHKSYPGFVKDFRSIL
ncbi:MAG: 3-phosphoshikimate 1-carboxyvinyltransferase [Candidatus Omnitrophica bacterium]|nr:3-phosphoshikimate 1-carboxyvinyltransferase [Candidatus Omnitrophota bacterium]